MSQKIRCYWISMFPTVSLQEMENIESVLGVFEQNEKMIPEIWGNTELTRLAYDKKEIVDKVATKDFDFEEVFLYRKHAIRYDAWIRTKLFKGRPYISVKMDKGMSRKHIESVFDMAEKLASIAKPNYGVANIVWTIKRPWESEQERLKGYMRYCQRPVPVSFGKGPLGVGMRTYFGGDVLESFGRDFLKNAPAEVTELEWGGIRIDLFERPWEKSHEEILDKWLEVMEYLEPAKIFAIPKYVNERTVFFEKNQGWINKKNALID